MKKYIRFILLTIATLPLLYSCDNYLNKEPDDMLTLPGVFNDATNMKEWLAGIYDAIPDPLWDYLSYSYGYYLMSDESQINSELGQFGWNGLLNVQQGSWSPVQMVPGFDLWGTTYQKVRAALIFLDNVKPLPEQRQTEELIERYKNEVRFLMAYYYERMLEVYGPFPLVTTLSDATASPADLQLPRTPYDDIVSYLDKNLLDLSKVLPSSYDDTDVGHVTSGMCLAVRARLLMFAASPLFNGNTDYADVTNKDGTALFNSTYDADKWKKAADAAKQVIDMPLYKLYTEKNEDGTLDALMSCMNVHLKGVNENPEIIFVYPQKTNYYYEYHILPRGSGFAGCIGTTQNMVDAFFMNNGKSITDNGSNYNPTGFSTSDDYYNTQYNYGDANRTTGLVTRKGTFNMYVNREPRFYVNIRYNGEYCTFDDNGRDIDFKKNGLDGAPSHDSPLAGYQINKAVNPSDHNGQTFQYRPGIIIRLAEMYLDYAEALNEYNPKSTDIAKYVNLIRERAGLPGLPEGLSQSEMRDAIHHERQVEFALEGGMRYMDIRRWKIAEDVFKKPIQGLNTQGTTANDYYKVVDIQTRNFQKKMYLWPIYQNYMDNNANLVQNKYW